MQTTAILKETVVAFDLAKRQLPGAPTVGQLYYWRRRGIQVSRRSKRRVTIEWCLVGGRPHTSAEAYERFLEKINREEGT